MIRAWRRYGSLSGHQPRFDRNQSIAERSRISIQKIREVAGRQAAIACECEQLRQPGWVPQDLRNDAADANLSVRIAHALKIVRNIEIRGVADGSNGHRRHSMPGRFRQNCVTFHFHGFRLRAEPQLFFRTRYYRPRRREPFHLPRAAIDCRRQQLRMARDGYRFARFTDEACGQDVTRTVLSSKCACQSRRDTNIGPVRQRSTRRLKRLRLPHARQDRADARTAELRFEARPIAWQSPELPAIPPRREFRFDREHDQNIHRSRCSPTPHARAPLHARLARPHTRLLRTTEPRARALLQSVQGKSPAHLRLLMCPQTSYAAPCARLPPESAAHAPAPRKLPCPPTRQHRPERAGISIAALAAR